MQMRMKLAGILAIGMVGCGGGSEGDLTIVLAAEETISEGIEAGDGEENIVDGWNVQYDQLIVSIGDVRIARGGTSDAVTDAQVTVIDLAQLPTSGQTLTSFTGLTAARWDRISYGLVAPTTDAVRNPNVSEADFNLMTLGACTYLMRGTITPAAGSAAQSVPPGGSARAVPATGIAFDFCVPAPVTFTSCQSDGVPGIAIPSGGSTTASFTLHGDHLVFPSFGVGSELVQRRAQWLVNADTNADDALTRAELEAITGPSLVALFPSDLDPGTPGNQGYSLTGAPGGAITNAFAFVIAQLRTQGHLNGEGECEPVVP